jgi:hypothetical protein
MDYRIKIQELAEFNNLIDNIIDELENGTIKQNPLLPKLEEELEEVVELEEVAEVAEVAEEVEVVQTEEANRKPRYKEGLLVSKSGEILAVYKNAVEMAEIHHIHPTTARNRCLGNFVDENENTWYYRDKYEESIK